MKLQIIQIPDYVLGVEIKENYKITPDTVYFDKYSKVVNTAKASGYGTWYLIIGHISLNNAKPLEGVPLLPETKSTPVFFEAETEYKDGFGYWYDYTPMIAESLKNPFDLRLKVINGIIQGKYIWK